MKLLNSIVCMVGAISVASSQPLESAGGPYSVHEAASIARTLVNRESLSQFNTIQQGGSFDGWPVSFVEYYSDCHDDGNPFLLLVDISTDFHNIESGSKLSLSIKVGDHQLKDKSNPHYPGGIVSSTMGSPRVMLTGQLVNAASLYSTSDLLKITKCFVTRHKDAAWWLPGSKIHSSHWWQFQVEGVYFIGGFGDRAYIGEVPLDEYNNATLLDQASYDETLVEIHRSYHQAAAAAGGNHHHYQQSELSFFDKLVSRFSSVLF